MSIHIYSGAEFGRVGGVRRALRGTVRLSDMEMNRLVDDLGKLGVLQRLWRAPSKTKPETSIG